MNTTNSTVFPSAVDAWYYGVILFSSIAVVVAFLPAMGDASWTLLALALATIGIAVGYPAWLIVSTFYRVDEATLFVQCGLFRWRIPLDEIHEVHPSRSVWSSPALSLNRLEIRYSDNKVILISPLDRAGFRECLSSACAKVGVNV